MFIKNKQESDYFIKKLRLNHIEEKIFTQNQLDKLQDYLKQTSYQYYNIRDKSTPMGTFLYKLTKKQVIEYAKQIKIFSVYESLYQADEKLVLQGEILLTKDFNLIASLSTQKGISNRLAMRNPQYTINVDLKESKLPNIRGLTFVVDYICLHELFDVVVEFSLYDTPVGVNREKIVIWELRNY